ncbi:hypothetical protein NL676_029958 [Syzygium grande]|nr:hypothetical protein NL676_029958 [Syzygium grande]
MAQGRARASCPWIVHGHVSCPCIKPCKVHGRASCLCVVPCIVHGRRSRRHRGFRIAHGRASCRRSLTASIALMHRACISCRELFIAEHRARASFIAVDRACAFFMAEHCARALFPWIVHGRASCPCIVYSWPRVTPVHRDRGLFMAEHQTHASFVHGRGSRPCIVHLCPRVAALYRAYGSFMAEHHTRASCLGIVHGLALCLSIVAECIGPGQASWLSASVLAEPRGRVHRSCTRLMAECIGLARGIWNRSLVHRSFLLQLNPFFFLNFV